MYSRTVQKLLAELPNRGCPENPHRSGEAENPICGDWIRIHICLDGDLISEARFEASGCPAALAAAAGLTQLLQNQEISVAAHLTTESLIHHLEGLPRHKVHGAEMALAALRECLEDKP